MKKNVVHVLYEDDHVIAVNKPPRVLTLPADGETRTKTVVDMVQRQYEEKGIKPYALHRLDMDTSGVLLFGKKPEDRAAMEGIFKDNRTQKIYVALLKGLPREGVIKHFLPARHSDVKIEAHTEFKILEVFNALNSPCAFIEAEIKTGRKHQIRQHFANIGFPVVMDNKYGDPKFNRRFRLKYRLGRHFLHAASMKFFHPFLKRVIFVEAPLPPDLKVVAKRMWQPRTK